jgi:hypothetical protein
MSKMNRVYAMLSAALWIGSGAIAQSQEASAAGLARPKFGTESSTTTVVAGSEFRGYLGFDRATFSATFPICGSGGCDDDIFQARAAVAVPSGAVITSVGVNTATTTGIPMTFSLYSRDQLGNTANRGSYTIPTHAEFATDYFDIDDFLVPSNSDHVLVIVVRSPATDTEDAAQYLGYVEVAWLRSVSEPPDTPSFGDVSPFDPFYQYIEALARSGITGGCGGGNYCPDASLTRGQMAVFLSKALGLHWPQ